jgi:hypothetical protein
LTALSGLYCGYNIDQCRPAFHTQVAAVIQPVSAPVGDVKQLLQAQLIHRVDFAAVYKYAGVTAGDIGRHGAGKIEPGHNFLIRANARDDLAHRHK